MDSSEKRIEYVNGVPVYRRRGNLLPIAWLNQVLGLPSVENPEALNMVVLQAEDQQFGLMVDGINDTQEIVVKPLGKQLKCLSVYAGATIMGDGHVALILDVHGIGQRSGVFTESREQNRAAAVEQKVQSAVELQRLLLFRAGSFQRIAVPLSLVARLEEFPRDSVELAGGCQVVQYRGRILPLVALSRVLEPGVPEVAAAGELIQVIVFKDDDRSVGVIVDQILDVAEELITTHQKSNRKGLLGSAIVGKMVTDFLDLGYVIRSATENWLQGTSGLPSGKRVLVAEASAFSRGLIRSGLDMAGYQVLEASNLGDAIRGLGQDVDAVVAGLNLPPGGCSALMAEMRKNPLWQAIPAIALADPTPSQEPLPPCPEGFGDCVAKFDREAMIESLARLAAAIGPAAVSPAAEVLAGGKR